MFLNFFANTYLIAFVFFPLLSFSQHPVSKIAFGSCGSEQHPLPVFDVIVKHQPDLFIFLGDNIYGDTKSLDTLRAKYSRLANKPSFQHLKAGVPIIATWDDHDYGWNDEGRHFPLKEQSKQIFLDFFEEPDSSQRRKHKGIYTSYFYETEGKRLQVILLDGRTFRDNLKKYGGEVKKDKRYFYKLDYAPHHTPDSTLLGEEQWTWLEEELKKPADLRLICSGTQFGIEYNGYEAWANFPHEQQRFFDLVKKTKAGGVMFLTGDVHYAEISRMVVPGIYPIFDITASGLSSTWEFATPNKNRIKGPVMENHFGLLSIDWKKADPTITMEIWDVNNQPRIKHKIALSELQSRR
jgi:alkaline phosphatase D